MIASLYQSVSSFNAKPASSERHRLPSNTCETQGPPAIGQPYFLTAYYDADCITMHTGSLCLDRRIHRPGVSTIPVIIPRLAALSGATVYLGDAGWTLPIVCTPNRVYKAPNPILV